MVLDYLNTTIVVSNLVQVMEIYPQFSVLCCPM